MIVDVRTYTLIPRKQAKYLELFEKRALPVAKRHGLELMSYYVSYIGALNQVVHLWRYENLADMEKKRAARDADPAWGEFLSLTEGMLLLQEDKVMRPASFSPIRQSIPAIIREAPPAQSVRFMPLSDISHRENFIAGC